MSSPDTPAAASLAPAERLAIWNQVAVTDPNHTKAFSRGGGFKGSAINSTYLIRKATELWGPMGARWGARVLEEKMLQGAPMLDGEGKVMGHELIHQLHVELHYPYTVQGVEGQGRITHFGQTQFVGRNKNGMFTDEEAPKKSMTDAIGKCLSMLGFSADIYLGLYDDSKYVDEVKREHQGTVKPTVAPKMSADEVTAFKAKIAACATLDALREMYEQCATENQALFKAAFAGRKAALERAPKAAS